MFLTNLKLINRFRSHQLIRHISSKPSSHDNDLFGIKDVTNYDVMGTKERENVNEDKFNKKYAYLNKLNQKDSEETVINYPHGQIRLDSDNKAKYHGQFDEDNEQIRFDIKSIEELNEEIADENEATKELSKQKLEENEINQLMQSITRAKENQKNESLPSQPHENVRPEIDPLKPSRIKVDTSNVDIYDLKPIKSAYSSYKLVYNVNLMYKSFDFKFEQQWADWIERDQKCCKSPLAELMREQQLLLSRGLEDRFFEIEFDRMKRKLNKQGSLRSEEQNFEKEDESNLYTPLKSLSELEQELIEDETIEDESIRANEMKIQPIFEQQIIEPKSKPVEMTAVDYMRMIKNREVNVEVKKLKSLIDQKSDKERKVDNLTFKPQEMLYDSKGFKNYKHQVLNLYKLNNVDRALYLESETFFNHHGFVALNKPYGLICMGDKELIGMEVSDRDLKPVKLTSFLDDYTKLIAMQDKESNKENTFDDPKNPKLYPIIRLDRNCTGVYILAKNKETAIKLHDLFKNKQVNMFYDAITKMVPTLEKATIDIPIQQDFNDRHRRMVLKPVLPEEYQVILRPSKYADKAITNYKVIKSFKGAAYIELNPLTSIRHQLRVHLGHGLRTPILGDHLYDDPEKVIYQKLPTDMLLSLNIRATKTLQLPLHLHCKLMILNQFGTNGRDVFLKADLPEFFKDNLKSLRLK